jgi:predicted Zn finger-like uncharacterized protein
MPVRISCPSCNKALRVPDASLGRKVRCPACSTAFTAEAPPEEETEGIQTAPTSDSGAAASETDEEESDAIRKEPVPRRKRPPAAEEPEEEDEDAPRRGRRRRGRDPRAPKRSHHGPIVMTLGILSMIFPLVGLVLLVCCGALGSWLSAILALLAIGLGLPAWIMGQRDLGAMRRGEMDFSGETATKGGWICGIVGTILGAVCMICVGIWLIAFVSYVATGGH